MEYFVLSDSERDEELQPGYSAYIYINLISIMDK